MASSESRENAPRFENLKGFTYADQLTDDPSTVAQYEAAGLTGAEPGKYAQNNGTLALVTSEGKIALWIPKVDPTAPREVSYAQAIASLKSAGYREGNFYVPESNG